MNKLLHRCAGLLRGSFDALLAPAVDPRLAFASAEQRQHDLLALARRALAELATTRGQLEARMLAIQGHLPQLEQQAQRSLAAGREDLARVALRRRQIAAAELRLIEQQVQELQGKEHLVALHEERLAAQAEVFQSRLKLISASYSAAELQVRMNEAFGSVSKEMSDLSLALEQAEQQTEAMQAHAAALESLVRGVPDGPGPPDGDGAELGRALLAEEELVEQQLAALKRRLRETSAPAPKNPNG